MADKIYNENKQFIRGIGALIPKQVTADFTAASGFHYQIDTTAGIVNVYLPSGMGNTIFQISDLRKNFGVNKVILHPALGQQILGTAAVDETLEVDVNGYWLILYWDIANSIWSYNEGVIAGGVVGQATPNIIGLNSSFAPVVKDSINNVATDYPILDNDGYATINVTTGATDKTITLPNAANNTGREICFRKADSGAGKLIINDGTSNINHLIFQNGTISYQSDGTNWFVSVQAYEEGTPAITLDNSVNLSNTGGVGHVPNDQKVTRIGRRCFLSFSHGANVTQQSNSAYCSLSYENLPYLTADLSENSIGGTARCVGPSNSRVIVACMTDAASNNNETFQVSWGADTSIGAGISVTVSGYYDIKEDI